MLLQESRQISTDCGIQADLFDSSRLDKAAEANRMEQILTQEMVICRTLTDDSPHTSR